MQFDWSAELGVGQPQRPSSYGTNRPLLATKFSRRKEISHMLADIIYTRAVVVKVSGAGNPTTTRISAMISAVCRCQIDDFALLPFRPKMFIAIFMDADLQEELSERAFKKVSFTFKATRLTFEPFKMNLGSTVNPLCQRVILALEGVPPESWNKEAISELMDSCCFVEELYGEHHIQELSIFKLAAWTTDCDLIPKVISWNIETKEGRRGSANISWMHNATLSVVLVHIEKLFDYTDEDSGSDSDGEVLREYEQQRPRVPVVKTFSWVPLKIDLNNGPVEGGTPAIAPRRLPLEVRRRCRLP